MAVHMAIIVRCLSWQFIWQWLSGAFPGSLYGNHCQMLFLAVEVISLYTTC